MEQLRKRINQIIGKNFKHIEAIFVYKDNSLVSYGFAPFIEDNPDNFYKYNSHIEKILEYKDRLREKVLYYYKVNLGKKYVYLFVYKIYDMYFFIFTDELNLDIAPIIYEQILKPITL
ncbi:hypothetical protein [Persephonella sp. KM09-Lau-8]|uniref:hypothetical protein n=1 Tax=Persephonella sp. KM09-Lau-8 TaxID=1158345 RepID=UPI00049686A7|nr:hypothetical protein [Persephonella sp. KM09-Lau-8]